jgi:hypothetical protein
LQLHDGQWTWHSLVSKGKIQPAFQLLCPTTAGLLQRMPGFMTGVPFAYAFFSNLNPGASA